MEQMMIAELDQEPEQEYVPEAEYKYKGFIIRVEQRTNPELYTYSVHAVYQGNTLLAICDANAARHVIDAKLKTGVWANVHKTKES